MKRIYNQLILSNALCANPKTSPSQLPEVSCNGYLGLANERRLTNAW